MHIARFLLPLAALALTACAPAPGPAAGTLAHPQEAFWQALSSHCGKAYAGGLASTDARDADWAGKRMVAHWAECEETRVAIAFHVEEAPPSSGSEAVEQEPSWNRSRTWIVTREGTGADTRFTLKHDHRHADGEADAVTFYGGTTADAGSASAQDFPVDAESVTLFTREGLGASLTNVWRIEVTPRGSANARFAYQLTRRNDPTRVFRVEIDANARVEPPPAAWGW
ncbi:MAG: hypothetical protein OSA41_08485 [Erythrobacter sp.]|jgi:hypothetical protein|uniref:hypothetical protein n=1 Tax=Qipengyuania citrea TaxID=225971 RepID=UPI00209E125F|nr:hypothetical protein [Qipengyuania citrea]MCP2018335.1 hypothetical protein [Qipengyuania citrea]MDE0901740.1 hypothetical protein [Erythrobacter sp.]